MTKTDLIITIGLFVAVIAMGLVEVQNEISIPM